jgi:hypothetical protein
MGRLKRNKLDSEVGLMCNGGRGTGLAWTPVPQWQPHPTILLRIGIPLGALSKKSWIPKLDRCTLVGEAKDSDWPPSHRHPFTFPCQSPQCISPTKNLLRIGIPLGALSEKSWIPK